MKKKRFLNKIFGNVAFGFLLLSVTPVVPAWGQSLKWVRQDGGAGTDVGNAIAVDDAGNSYVTGYFLDTATFGSGEANETVLPGSGNFLAKYAGDGSLVWVTQADSDVGRSIAVDKAGNSYVTGGMFVSKYDSDGDLLWIQPHSSEGSSIAVDKAGNCYVTGGIYVTDSMFVSKYATDGTLDWVRQVGGSAGIGIAVDGDGNSYVTGRLSYTATFAPGEANETVLSGRGNFLAKYAGNGSLAWARELGRIGLGIAVDRDGNIYLTGIVFSMELGDNGQLFVAKYDSDGNLVWDSRAEDTWDAPGTAIAVDEAGDTYVTGALWGQATFGAGEANETVLPRISGTTKMVFVAKYDGDGGLLWAEQAAVSLGVGLYDISSNGIAFDGDGNIYLTGSFHDEAIFGPGEANETFLTTQDEDTSDAYVAKYVVSSIGDTIQDLIDKIEGFGLNRGFENSLNAKLRNALRAVEADNADQRRNATTIIEGFINEVEAQRGNELMKEQADRLIGFADRILAKL